jgi:zinc D-Ala-D-Ala carboxypeptidase
MNLSPNFSLHELTKSETALRNDLDNTPGEAETENLRLLCEKVLQPVRDHFGKGVKVNSGFRAPAVNQATGGSKTSDHCLGRAADIEIPGVANADLAAVDHGQLGLHPVDSGVLHTRHTRLRVGACVI